MPGKGEEDNRVGTFVTIEGEKAIVLATTDFESALPNPDPLWR
jgi:hypothetical protein